ncbi:MAG: hypothetical protein KDK37_04015 [Leptospiraceae bacterium]|nr:hypothetical protein [Leptospiraceae bacterium]
MGPHRASFFNADRPPLVQGYLAPGHTPQPLEHTTRPSPHNASLKWVFFALLLIPLFFRAEGVFGEEVGEALHQKLDQELRDLRTTIKGYSFKCYGAASKLVGPDALATTCTIPSRFAGDGDSTLWNGLLCFTGKEPWACDAVRDSQTTDGRIWRSPRRKLSENDGNDYPQASFSRDMSRGVMLYLLRTGDTVVADQWSAYISRTGAFCPDQQDWSCDVRTQSYRRMNHVMETIGATRLVFAYTVFPCLWPAYPLTSAMHETMMERRVRENESFHLHLAAIDLLMDSYLTDPMYDAKTRHAMVEILFQRKPYNLFYQYLAQGPTIDLKRRILRYAPRSRPQFLSQWVWERELPQAYLDLSGNPEPGSEKEEEAFLRFIATESMGWDFVFLIDLVEGGRPEHR